MWDTEILGGLVWFGFDKKLTKRIEWVGLGLLVSVVVKSMGWSESWIFGVMFKKNWVF